MRWLAAWWRQFAGGPSSDPWRDDPRIHVERLGQHDRINRATPASSQQSIEERKARLDLLDIQADPRGDMDD